MQNENYRNIPLRELNQRLGITAEYLYGVQTDKYFAIKREKIRVGFPVIKAPKIDLYGYLQEVAKPNELGFKISQLPNRKWMENILFTIAPTHLIFKKPAMEIPERTFDIPEWFIGNLFNLIYFFC